MTEKLQGKTALITGGGRGIGLAIGRAFAEEGARVILSDVDGDSAVDGAAGLAGGAFGLRMDVADKAQVEACFDQVLSRCGKLDILVNNAGFLTYSTFEDCPEELWDRIIDINLKGTFLCAQAAIGPMKQQGSGCMINMTSLAAKSGGLAAGPAYAAAKAGVYTLTIALLRRLRADEGELARLVPSDDRLEEEARRLPVVLPHQRSVRQHRRQLVGEHAFSR